MARQIFIKETSSSVKPCTTRLFCPKSRLSTIAILVTNIEHPFYIHFLNQAIPDSIVSDALSCLIISPQPSKHNVRNVNCSGAFQFSTIEYMNTITIHGLSIQPYVVIVAHISIKPFHLTMATIPHQFESRK